MNLASDTQRFCELKFDKSMNREEFKSLTQLHMRADNVKAKVFQRVKSCSVKL